MKLLCPPARFFRSRAVAALAVAAVFLAGAGAVPAADDIPFASVKELAVTEGSALYPVNRDIVAPSKKNPDKAVGTWNWETVEKLDVTDFPTDEKPWKDKAKIEGLIASMPRLLDCDVSAMKAHPAAADFPGVPEGDIELVERTVEIDPSITGWHSTGLWAPPGAKITVEMVGKTKFPFTLRIGSQTDQLSMKALEDNHGGQLKRMPRLTNSLKIGGEDVKKRKFQFANPFGGLIYFDVGKLNSKKAKLVKVKVSGAAPAALYIYEPGNAERQTTKEDWAAQMKTIKAPWGEIRTPRLVFTLPLDMLKATKKKHINAICSQLHLGMIMEDWLAAWDMDEEKFSRPMRFVIDQQISLGWGHSGYPAMGYRQWASPISTSGIIKGGHWGLWHELGHNHQIPTPYFYITEDDLTEVTCNVFSTIAQTQGCGIPYETAWDGTGIDEASMAQSVLAFLKSDESFGKHGDVRVKLYFYVELMRELGFDAFRAVGVRYMTKPTINGYSSASDRWDWFLSALSQASGKNLGPYFKLWKVGVTEKSLARAAKYPAWEYLENYPKKINKSAKKKKRKKK